MSNGRRVVTLPSHDRDDSRDSVIFALALDVISRLSFLFSASFSARARRIIAFDSIPRAM